VPGKRDPRDLEKLVERFERVAHARADSGKLDAPADQVLAEIEAGSPAPIPFPDLESWWQGGERIEVELPGGARRRVFARVIGSGPWLTCLHGFPTSSWDWAKVAPALSQHHTLLVFDLLGFGDSDKPRGHDWSAFEQADIVEALWRQFGVGATEILAHDVGLTVALELLARQQDDQLEVRLGQLTLLNGGVYAGFHRPRPVQRWLQRPLVGPLVARLLSEPRFGKALAEVFSPDHQPTAGELHQHWLSVSRRGGSANYHRLIRYIPERRAHAPRWEGALEKSAVPVRFVWGMADPVSGAHMVDVVRQRRPGADVVELPGVGHYPQLEAADAVVAALIRNSATLRKRDGDHA